MTSNVAILAGEFAEAKEEEADEFDEAFDALGESTKLNLITVSNKTGFKNMKKKLEPKRLYVPI